VLVRPSGLLVGVSLVFALSCLVTVLMMVMDG